MSDPAPGLSARVLALRSDFDHSFTLPVQSRPPTPHHLLSLAVGGSRVAIRLAEVVSLHTDQRLAKVPGATVGFLGLATVRGQAWPVYDLSHLLERSRQGPPRVLCLARHEPRIAFACEHFYGLFRVHAEAISAGSPSIGASEVVLEEGGFIPLISLAALAAKCIKSPLSGRTNEEGAPT